MRALLAAAGVAALVACVGAAGAPPRPVPAAPLVDYHVAFTRMKPRPGMLWQYAVFTVGSDPANRWEFDCGAVLANAALRPRKHVFFEPTPQGGSRRASMSCSFRIPRKAAGRKLDASWTATIDADAGNGTRSLMHLDGAISRWTVARR